MAFDPVDVEAAVQAVAVRINSDVFEPATGIADGLFAFECSLDPVSLVDETDPAVVYTTTGRRAYIESQPTSYTEEKPPTCSMTFAHQIARPSAALSHTCASANSDPAAHAVFLAAVASNRLRALPLEVLEAHTASHAIALVRSEFLVGVEMLATRDARKRSAGSARPE